MVFQQIYETEAQRQEARRGTWNKYRREARQRMKDEIYSLLGNACRRCGFRDPRALQIDHVNNDGYVTRQREQSSYRRAKKILEELKAGITGRYQILCANCNWIKREMVREVAQHG